ncbi:MULTISPECIES: GTPase domain-containing protein [Alcaligenes]|uniref:GTPase domain-containing protein n=1 Tax=Alcaligenes TaxID=507 RepID=UPI001F329897|nr:MULTISPECIES: GTPase domain-containing protein [Alcaligenes]HRO18846.1 GTPase domain-containing protein [Alcaligenes phenolicus]HRP14683.1 GTPase domain-containing protein [Alcaligenes phenolicus]
MLLPWSGLAMGEVDLNFVSSKAKPIIVGIVGPESAGKTTILGALYLMLGRGALTTGTSFFSNSYTLAGWEAVATSLRWKPGQLPSFPPHTPSGAARAPGMLHLAFRHEDGALRDLLFADAPGEWFQKWAINEQDDSAEGARWIARHADVILLIADRQALAGSKMGTARNDFQLLAQRAVAEARGRRLVLVWTKGDVDVAPAMEAQIRKAVVSDSSSVPEFTVSVYPRDGVDAAEGFRELFDWILCIKRVGVDLPTTEASGFDPLFRFGRR